MTQPTNPNEIKFLIAVYSMPEDTYVRPVAEKFAVENNIAMNQIAYWLRKWADKELYNYGTSLFAGWLEDKGKEKAQKYISEAFI